VLKLRIFVSVILLCANHILESYLRTYYFSLWMIWALHIQPSLPQKRLFCLRTRKKNGSITNDPSMQWLFKRTAKGITSF